MSESVIAGLGGVNSAANPLSLSAGSLLQLQNMVSDMPKWASRRRGIKQLNATAGYSAVFSGLTAATTLPVCAWYFDDHIFVYVEDSTSGGSGIAAYSMVQTGGWQKVVESTVAIRVDTTQYKVHPCIVDRRLLFPTSSGVKRLPAIYNDHYPKDSATAVAYSGMYRNAGLPRAIDPRCRNAVAGGATDHGLIALTGFEWLLLSSAVGYRITWFKRDENGIPSISAPSGRIVVRNSSTTTNYATRLKVVLPSGVTDSSYVMQIYRTNIISMDGAGVIPDPGDDMFLAGEYKLTSTDLSNGYVLYEDVSFDPLLGDALYTNEFQEGNASARYQPPLCRDIASFGGCSFFSNVTERQRMVVKVLAVDSSGIGTFKGITVGDKIVIGDLVMVGVATANEETQQYNFAVDATVGAGSEVIRCLKTTESICYKYNVWSNAKNGRYAAYNMTSNNDIVGVIMLEEKSVGGGTGVYLGVNRVDAPVQILPAPVFTSTPANTLAQACAVDTDVGLTRVQVTAAAAHNLTSNDLVFLAPFAASTTSGTSSPKLINTGVPSGVYKVTVTGATTFTFTPPSGSVANQTDARAATTGGYFHKIFDTTGSIWTEARSKNSYQPNRLMWSAPFEPECAPPANTKDIGAADRQILRIVPTQDSLFIFKEDGVWRLKGEEGDWEIIVLDKSCILAAPETPGVVDGRVFAFSTNGVVAIDDGGVNKISQAVSGLVDNYYRAVAQTPVAAMAYCGVGHGEDQSYWLLLDGEVYRYHCPTRSWSNHSWKSKSGGGDGAVSFLATVKASRYTSFDNQAYAERLLVCFYDVYDFIGVERRTGTVSELCDIDIPVTVTSIDSTAKTVTLSAPSSEAEVGDTFMWYVNTTYSPGGYGSGSQSKRRAAISAINGAVLTLSGGNISQMSSWPAPGGTSVGSIIKRIASRVIFSPIEIHSGFAPGHFSEIEIVVGSRANFTTMTVGFTTDQTTSSTILSDGDYTSAISGYATSSTTSTSWANRHPGIMPITRAFKTGIPRQASTSPSLVIALSSAAAFEQFDVAGIKLLFNEITSGRRTNA